MYYKEAQESVSNFKIMIFYYFIKEDKELSFMSHNHRSAWKVEYEMFPHSSFTRNQFAACRESSCLTVWASRSHMCTQADGFSPKFSANHKLCQKSSLPSGEGFFYFSRGLNMTPSGPKTTKLCWHFDSSISQRAPKAMAI